MDGWVSAVREAEDGSLEVECAYRDGTVKVVQVTAWRAVGLDVRTLPALAAGWPAMAPWSWFRPRAALRQEAGPAQ